MMRVSLSASVAAAALLAAPLALSGAPAHAQQAPAQSSTAEDAQAVAQPTGNGTVVVPANKNHLPTHVDAQELAQLYQHSGITPCWENNGRQVGRNNPPAASQSEAGSGSSAPPPGAR